MSQARNQRRQPVKRVDYDKLYNVYTELVEKYNILTVQARWFADELTELGHTPDEVIKKHFNKANTPKEQTKLEL